MQKQDYHLSSMSRNTEVPTFLLIKHFKENHSDCFLATPSFKIDVSAPCIQKYLYRVKDNLFLIECQVTFEDMISFNTFFLGEPEKAEKIKQKFSIYHKDLSENIVTLTKTCLPFGCEDSGAFLPMKREVQFIFVVFELLHDLDEFFIFPGSISKTKRSPLPIPLKMKLVSSTPMVHFSECGFDSGINISCEMKDKSKISQPFLFGKERVPANMENEKFGAPKISNAMKDQIKIGPPSIFGEGSIFGKERVPANIENEEKFGAPEISNAMKDQITTGPPSIFGERKYIW
ncbi:hypothetical protein JTB14_007039 [Gonioctena quinquepunctata]|nr:hypothetical protein JTB14_007039 [Gonioctena quinquepunctata]